MCASGDEPLAEATGIRIAKIDTGFPGATFNFAKRSESCPLQVQTLSHALLSHLAVGNISTFQSNVNTYEVDLTVQEQMEKMAQAHAGKGNDINPFITFDVEDIEN